MIQAIIRSDNLLIRYGLSSLLVFGTLYFLNSFGVPGMQLLALIIVAGIVISFARENNLSIPI